jgi:single-stranded-DNA-specific exonuclease
VEAFRDKFEQIVAESIDPQMLIPEIVIDAEINFQDISPAFLNIIRQMEPFGPENLRPVFLARKVVDTGYSRIVKEQHLRFVVRQNNATMTGIRFGMSECYHLLSNNRPVDLVFKIEENEYNGQTSLQLRVIDCRAAE